MTSATSAATPASFPSVVGHAALKERCARLVEQDRVPNGLLFVGEDGRGKRTFAVALAAELLARGAPPAEAARARRRALAGLHPELIIVEPPPGERFLPVRRVRRLLDRCALSIGEGDRRVVVLPRMQKLNEESGNALLKFLEEPPPGTVILGSASDASLVLETIRSRLVTLRAPPLSDADTAAVLSAEGLSPDEAALLAPLAAGAPGRAFRLRRGDVEASLSAPLRALLDPGVAPFAFAETLAKSAKERGPDWAEEEEALGPPAAAAAFVELRAAKEEGADGEKSATPTLEAARSWLRPICEAAGFLAADLRRRALGVAPRAAELLAATGAEASPLGRAGEAAAGRAALAALAASARIDRNVGLPATLEVLAAAFRPES